MWLYAYVYKCFLCNEHTCTCIGVCLYFGINIEFWLMPFQNTNTHYYTCMHTRHDESWLHSSGNIHTLWHTHTHTHTRVWTHRYTYTRVWVCTCLWHVLIYQHMWHMHDFLNICDMYTSLNICDTYTSHSTYVRCSYLSTYVTHTRVWICTYLWTYIFSQHIWRIHEPGHIDMWHMLKSTYLTHA